MELFDYLAELETTTSPRDRERRAIREAHLAVREIDADRGAFDNWWHAGCNSNMLIDPPCPPDRAPPDDVDDVG